MGLLSCSCLRSLSDEHAMQRRMRNDRVCTLNGKECGRKQSRTSTTRNCRTPRKYTTDHEPPEYGQIAFLLSQPETISLGSASLQISYANITRLIDNLCWTTEVRFLSGEYLPYSLYIQIVSQSHSEFQLSDNLTNQMALYPKGSHFKSRQSRHLLQFIKNNWPWKAGINDKWRFG